MALTQSRYQGSKLLKASEASQGPQFSQVTLPCNSLGSIDFSNYPFRVSFFDFQVSTFGRAHTYIPSFFNKQVWICYSG